MLTGWSVKTLVIDVALSCMLVIFFFVSDQCTVCSED